MTRGSEGSLATPARQLHILSIPSVVTDTIGAGACYMAALIYGLLALGAKGLTTTVLETLGRTA